MAHCNTAPHCAFEPQPTWAQGTGEGGGQEPRGTSSSDQTSSCEAGLPESKASGVVGGEADLPRAPRPGHPNPLVRIDGGGRGEARGRVGAVAAEIVLLAVVEGADVKGDELCGAHTGEPELVR